MGLNIKIETIEEMKIKFPKALEKEWNAEENNNDRPGLYREHVFDFPSGMRWIVSRDYNSHVAPFIHVSLSKGTEKEFLSKLIEITDNKYSIELVRITIAGVRHYVLKEVNYH